jgi:inorganic phosphate transporter, PiT family
MRIYIIGHDGITLCREPPTTHTITGGIVGVGSVRRLSAVRWGVAGDIVIAWIVTIPAAALVGALFYGVSRLL